MPLEDDELTDVNPAKPALPKETYDLYGIKLKKCIAAADRLRRDYRAHPYLTSNHRPGQSNCPATGSDTQSYTVSAA